EAAIAAAAAAAGHHRRDKISICCPFLQAPPEPGARGRRAVCSLVVGGGGGLGLTSASAHSLARVSAATSLVRFAGQAETNYACPNGTAAGPRGRILRYVMLENS